MVRINRLGGLFTGFAAVTLIVASGCGKDGDKGKGKDATTTGAQQAEKKGGHEHGAWWCTEHGIPEEMCSLCLPDEDVQKMFKDKGDWCELHDRAKSQCFKCEPKLYEKYEAMYVAKYGKKPPRPPAKEFQK